MSLQSHLPLLVALLLLLLAAFLATTTALCLGHLFKFPLALVSEENTPDTSFLLADAQVLTSLHCRQG